MEELPAGVRAAMAMANGNRPTMTAEVVAVEEVHEASCPTFWARAWRSAAQRPGAAPSFVRVGLQLRM